MAYDENHIALAKNLKELADRLKYLISERMSKLNPVASGYFSMNRMENTANGTQSATLGKNGTAIGAASLAEGSTTVASGNYAHAEGVQTEASGKYSHAEGLRTVAAGMWQHVSGKFNMIDNENKYAEIVGGGYGLPTRVDDDFGVGERKDIRRLDWNGNAEFAGDVIARGCGEWGVTPVSLLDLKDEVDNKLSTDDVEDFTAAEIDNLFEDDEDQSA